MPSNENANTSKPLLLTPYIESGKLQEARELSKVRNFLKGSPQVEFYSGYLTVNKEYNSNLFFWFFPAQNGRTDVPIILWLQGGPGASCSVGIFNEHGPFQVNEDLKLESRDLALNKEFAVLYVDNPVGTGFSFTDNPLGYSKNMIDVARDLYEGLVQFYTLFTEYRGNPFWIAGESYGGKYATTAAFKVHSMGEEAVKAGMNLQGLLIGSGFCDPRNMMNYGDYLYNHSIIDEAQKDYFLAEQKKIVSAIDGGRTLEALMLFDALIHGSDSYYLKESGLSTLFNYTSFGKENSKLYCKFLEQESVCEAIHAGGDRVFAQNKMTCLKHMMMDFLNSVKHWVEALLDAEYKFLFWNGNLDVLVAPTLSDNFLKNLKWKGSDKYYSAERKIYKLRPDDTEAAGYVRHVNNMTVVVIRNAGHLCPLDKPEVVLDLMTRVIKSQEFNCY